MKNATNIQASYLITGGLSGIGLAMAHKLANQGIAELILLGRRGLDTPNIQHEIKNLEKNGTKVYVCSGCCKLLSYAKIIFHNR